MTDPGTDVERRVAAALSARADQLQLSDQQADTAGPADAVVLALEPVPRMRRRWPALVSAGAVAAAVIVAVTLTLLASRGGRSDRTASGALSSVAAIDPGSVGPRPQVVVPSRPVASSTAALTITGTLQFVGNAPTPTSGKVLVHAGTAATGEVVARTQAGPDGSFTVALAPGTYFLTGTAAAAAGPTATHQAPCSAAGAIVVRAGVQLRAVVSCTSP